MAIAITEDFVTKSGLIVQGTGTVTSSTGQTTAFQAYSGAAIAKNLIVGTSAAIGANLSVQTTASIGTTLSVGTDTNVGRDVTIGRDLSVARGSRLVTVTATGIVSILNSTVATTASTGALVVTGGIYSNNLVVNSTTSNTGTTINNALYVAGGVGVGKSLVVDGDALFKGDVTFVGSSTYVYSVNSLYTDNLLEIHVPPQGATAWTIDDGKDIGLRFHYYSGSDKNAALVLSSDSRYLEWFDTGSENGSGDFVSGTYGTFKTGSIKLVGGTTSTNTQTGDLTVTGGVGIGKNLNVGTTVTSPLFIGNLTGIATTATNIQGGATGEIVYQSTAGVTTFLAVGTDGYVLKLNLGIPSWAPLSDVVVDFANTATNLKYGQDTQIPYQTGDGLTDFSDNLKYDYTNNRVLTVNATFTGTTNSTGTNSGALVVTGGVGIGKNLWVGSNSYVNGDSRISGDLSVNGGTISTTATTFNLINTSATTVNFAGQGTAITVGSNTGYTDIRTQVTITNITTATSTITGALTVAGGVGIGGELYVSGTTTVYSNILPAIAGISLGSLNIPFADLYLGGNSLYIGNLTISSNGNALTVTSSGGPANFTSPLITVTTTTNSTSTNSGGLVVIGGVGIGKNLWVGGNETILGDLEVRGGDITTDQTTFNLLNSSATTVNFAGSATSIIVGSSEGYTNIKNQTTVSSTATSLGTDTGALVVLGGVGISKDVWIGGNETILGNLEVRGGDITTDQTTFNLLNSNATTVNFAGASTALTISATSGYTNIRNATTLTNATTATSTSTGALTVRGGVGIGGALYVSTNSYINNSLILTQENIGAFGVTSITAGTDTAVNVTTGAVVIWNTSTLQTITGRGNSTTNVILITNTTLTTSTNSGALIVTGGVGIGKTLVVGSTATIAGDIPSISTTTGALQVIGGVGIGGDMYIKGIIYGVATTATNLGKGAAGQIPIQSNTGTTAFIPSGNKGDLLQYNDPSTATWVSTSTLIVGYSTSTMGGLPGSIPYQSATDRTSFINIGGNDTFLRSNGSSATFVTTGSMTVGHAALAYDVVGGLPGSLLYQDATDSTSFLPIAQSGYILQSNGTGPAWVEFPGGATVANATNVAITNDNSNLDTNYITFVNTSSGLAGIRTSGPSGITYIPASGNVGIGITTATAKLEVAGTVKISGVTNLTNNTIATSTTTGALQIIGGVGIGGSTYIGGNINVTGNGTFTGDIAVNGGDITTNQATFNLINAVSTAINFGGAATAISIGSSLGITTVKHNLVVVGNMTVQGTTTIVDSTVTNFADPIITVGGLSNDQPLTDNDNKDKGIAFKYYSGSAKVGFFGYNQGTGFFTFIPDATISNEVAVGTRGALNADLAGGSQQSLVYQSDPNKTSFLPAGNSGYLLQTNGTASPPSWIAVNNLTAGNANTSTNLAGGGIGQMPFQYAVGKTSFIGTGTLGQILVSQGSTSTGPVFTSTSSIRVGFANTTTNILGGSAGQVVFQTAVNDTSFAGPGFAGQLLVSQGSTSTGPIFVGTNSISVGGALNVLGGGPGQVLYQIAQNDTGYVSTGSTGSLLVSAYTGAPVFQSTSTILIGYSVTSTNLIGGERGSVPYQSTASITVMLPPGTVGSLLQTNGPGQAPTWVSPSGLSAQNAVTATNLSFGTMGQIPYQQNIGQTSFFGPGAAGQVLVSAGTTSTGPTFQSTLTLAGTTTASSTNTGALQVIGGVGIGNNLYVGGTGVFTGDIVANSGNITTFNTGTFNLINSSATNINFAGSGTAVTISSSTGYTNIRNLTTLTNATSATSTTSGALRVVGGVGIGGSLYVGGIIYGTFSGSITGNATTATNLSAGSAGTLVYQSAPGVSGYVGAGTSGQILISAGSTSTGPVFTSSSFIQVGFASNILNGSTGQILFQSNTSTTSFAGPGTVGQLLVSAGTSTTGPVFTNTSSIQVGFAANILGGSTGTLVYQSDVNTTALLPVSTSGYILQTNGAGLAPSWVTPSGLSAGSSLQIQTVAQASLAVYYPTFVDSNNTTVIAESVYTTSTFSINPGAREISVTGTGRFTSPANGQTGAVVLRQDAANTSGAYLQWTNNTSTVQTGYIQVTTTGTMIFGTTSTDRMIIDANNNVTIGTSLTGADGVSVSNVRNISFAEGTGTSYATIFRQSVSGGTVIANGYKWSLTANGFASSTGVAWAKSAIGLGSASGAAGAIIFYADAVTTVANGTDVTPSERMRITPTGALAFGGASNYGSDGQVLISRGSVSVPQWISVGTLYAGNATTATHLQFGGPGQIPFQTGPGQTSFISSGTAGQVLVSAGSTSTGPVFQSTLTLAGTTTSISTTTGALQVRGGVGVGGSVYVGNRIGFVNTSNVSVVYQYYNTLTNSLDTVFG